MEFGVEDSRFASMVHTWYLYSAAQDILNSQCWLGRCDVIVMRFLKECYWLLVLLFNIFSPPWLLVRISWSGWQLGGSYAVIKNPKRIFFSRRGALFSGSRDRVHLRRGQVKAQVLLVNRSISRFDLGEALNVNNLGKWNECSPECYCAESPPRGELRDA